MARSLILIAVIIVVLGGLFFILRPDNPASVPRDRTFDLSTKGGEMSPDEISVHEDDRVTLHISSDPTEVRVKNPNVCRNCDGCEAGGEVRGLLRMF